MPLGFENTSGNKYLPNNDIAATNRTSKPLRNSASLNLQPVLAFPTPVVENVMFYVDKISKTTDLKNIKFGTLYQPKGVQNVLPYMREAVLSHVQTNVEGVAENIYRYFYVVPYKNQHKYNQQIVKKDTDGYFFEAGKPAGTPKTYYQIVRDFVIPREIGYVPPEIKSYDPANFPQIDGSVLDAQLVHEETIQFEEDFLNKLYVKVRRFYWTIPGPVVKSLNNYPFYVKGDTVWQSGGPGTAVNPWVASVGNSWARLTWSASAPGVVPPMPAEAENANPKNVGFDKAEYSSVQYYVVQQMYQRNSGVTLTQKKETASENCCEPPRVFIKCERTSTASTDTTEWKDDTPLPPMPPIPTGPHGITCSKWQTSTDVTNKEGYSQAGTTSACTSYDLATFIYESKFDNMSGYVRAVTRELVENTKPVPTGFVDTTTGQYTYRVAVNGCYSQDVTEVVEGFGTSRSWQETVNASFPAILGDIVIAAWQQNANKTGRPQSTYKVSMNMRRNSFSGACIAFVQEAFSLGSPPWATPLKGGFVTNSGEWNTPFFSVQIPPSLHGEYRGTISVGSNEAVYAMNNQTFVVPATPETAWRPIVLMNVTPMRGGALYRLTTIQPPL